ncbi:hypothetical protein TCAP_07236 [Tolypocladium capitatum]|uniref:Uncharacterized protein n=1 Tax=Tolypocladium capitatum TaxID=45235 RepID=A0A2K3Q209_9HYPO|nr:hypothetical protein TCAP_07236 [Tolypocladium capitatum]
MKECASYECPSYECPSYECASYEVVRMPVHRCDGIRAEEREQRRDTMPCPCVAPFLVAFCCHSPTLHSRCPNTALKGGAHVLSARHRPSASAAVSPSHAVACERPSSLLCLGSPIRPAARQQPASSPLAAGQQTTNGPSSLPPGSPSFLHWPLTCEDNNKASLTPILFCGIAIASGPVKRLPLVLLPVWCVRRPSSAAARIRPPVFATSPPSPRRPPRRSPTFELGRAYVCTYSAHTAGAAHACRPPAGAHPARSNPILVRLRRLTFLFWPAVVIVARVAAALRLALQLLRSFAKHACPFITCPFAGPLVPVVSRLVVAIRGPGNIESSDAALSQIFLVPATARARMP